MNFWLCYLNGRGCKHFIGLVSGESLLTDTWEKKSPKFLPVDAVRNQGKLNSHFHQMPWKIIPVNNQGEIINQEKTLKDLQDIPETSIDLETNKEVYPVDNQRE
ncbi:hypothetical protein TNIN_205321 [Trichonephila inaurata madagascariensis]|uniref:Uncharacterized protein n=1 Tax=Trichonephila inaurata madagascariensis TaxID=2747483 RepID=A0A8X6XIP8_9ARAC|nr:hypothetical protein TNIN_205321 [Trichonephila inaurata madagascariensis]